MPTIKLTKEEYEALVKVFQPKAKYRKFGRKYDGFWQCNRCKYIYFNADYQTALDSYCTNCGAKMDMTQYENARKERENVIS